MSGRHFTFFPPLAYFPALCALGRVAYCKFSRAFDKLFFSALGTGWPTASFPALSTSYFFLAWHRVAYCNFSRSFNQLLLFGLAVRLIYGLQRLQTNIRSVKCFPSDRKRFTDLFYLSVLNASNKNLHSNAKSVFAEALSSCFFNDPSLSFWWAIRSLLQSFKIRESQWKKVRGILGGEENVWRHKFKNLWNSGVRWGSTPVRKNSDNLSSESTVP